jgi:guanylate kinase
VSPARGIPLVVAAASGTGKTTVCRRVIERNAERGGRDIVFSVSHTTRPPREGERDEHDYHFVSKDEFEALVKADGFLEWAEYNDNLYGTSRRELEGLLAAGQDVILEIEVQGAAQVRERLGSARFLFLVPPSMAELRSRLENRGTDSAEQVSRRLERARVELASAGGFDYAVVNDDVDRCVETVLEILDAERAGDAAALRERLDPRQAVASLQGGRPESRPTRSEP